MKASRPFEVRGPLSVTSESFKARSRATRFVAECCVCGWSRASDDRGLSFWVAVQWHLLSCVPFAPAEPVLRRGEPWTAAEDAELWSGSVREVAGRLGRSRSAVSSRRLNRPDLKPAAAVS